MQLVVDNIKLSSHVIIATAQFCIIIEKTLVKFRKELE